MTVTAISNEKWLESEMGGPHFLCQLPYSILEVESRLGLEFEEVIEDGLGEVFYCFIAIDSKEFFLKGFADKNIKDDFSVCAYMHSNEKEPKGLLDSVLGLLKLDKSELLQVGKYMVPPRYSLTRLDDNNNEVEISRFHDQLFAEHVRKRFEDRGHKQDYYVHEIKS